MTAAEEVLALFTELDQATRRTALRLQDRAGIDSGGSMTATALVPDPPWTAEQREQLRAALDRMQSQIPPPLPFPGPPAAVVAPDSEPVGDPAPHPPPDSDQPPDPVAVWRVLNPRGRQELGARYGDLLRDADKAAARGELGMETFTDTWEQQIRPPLPGPARRGEEPRKGMFVKLQVTLGPARANEPALAAIRQHPLVQHLRACCPALFAAAAGPSLELALIEALVTAMAVDPAKDAGTPRADFARGVAAAVRAGKQLVTQGRDMRIQVASELLSEAQCLVARPRADHRRLEALVAALFSLRLATALLVGQAAAALGISQGTRAIRKAIQEAREAAAR